jgi:hypothetical protein
VDNRQIRIQYWEKVGADEGLWVFACFGGDGPTDKRMEEVVWHRIERMEKLREKWYEKQPPELKPWSWPEEKIETIRGLWR